MKKSKLLSYLHQFTMNSLSTLTSPTSTNIATVKNHQHGSTRQHEFYQCDQLYCFRRRHFSRNNGFIILPIPPHHHRWCQEEKPLRISWMEQTSLCASRERILISKLYRSIESPPPPPPPPPHLPRHPEKFLRDTCVDGTTFCLIFVVVT
jgi:hypothetical protein